MNILNKEGIIIFELRMINDRLRDIVKAVGYFIFRKVDEFGDIPRQHNQNHHFTKRQLKRLFERYPYKIVYLKKNTEVYLKKTNDSFL